MDELTFKEAVSRFATGVTVVGTMSEQGPIGMTVTAFSSLSLQPPLVLVCIDRGAYLHDQLYQSQNFSVNLLAHHQLEWGMRFAGQTDERPAERFEDIDYLTAESGAPILPGCLAWVDCTLHTTHDGGDHTIFVGHVLASGNSPEDVPLLYFDRRWAGLVVP